MGNLGVDHCHLESGMDHHNSSMQARVSDDAYFKSDLGYNDLEVSYSLQQPDRGKNYC